MLAASTVAALQAIGRPGGRRHRPGACPAAIAYFGWHPAAPGIIGQAVANVPHAARCCPPSLPQRQHLAGAGLAFQVCCAGAAWAILPTSATATELALAGEWLHRLFPHEPVVCTIITPAGQPIRPEVPTWQRLHTALGPRAIVDRSHGGPSFTRTPPRFQTREKCSASCGDSPIPLLSCDPYVRAAFVAACIKPRTPGDFAETAWCADYAAKHGPIGVRQCANAAMGLGAASGVIDRPESRYPICRTGKDCTG